MMSCEEIQRTLSSYIDDALALPLRAACDRHLEQCPVCRAELAELRALTRSLSSLTRPVAPPDLALSITDALAIEAAALRREPRLPLSVHVVRWLQPRLMPYTIGTFASLLLFISLFSALRPHLIALREAEIATREATLYKVFVPRSGEYDITQPVSPEALSRSRAPFAVESPSLNPRGALAALALSHARGHSGDEEDDMVVVADVFSDGQASLAGVVQAPRDRRMLEDFQVALREGPAFVPASYDRRPQTMRVVFVVQKVSVPESGF
ncbi:MAG TPA: zf-HC2 domain-containing protein [Pyrinomonadaceae bacterium]|jgi:anti-sigma factor RsiW|nr:zf-HC2 domain-containing protein [Pyrinomonadaceae bacterium]